MGKVEPPSTEGGSPVATAEIVTIGDELLLGHTLDTNAAFISRMLGRIGIRVVRRTTVGDAEPAIAAAVQNALERATIVICTGGLGPTQDDVTRPALAALFEAPLEVRSDVLDVLRERYRVRGIPMPERNITQAQVPRGAVVLPNANGTAPGLVLRREHRLCILLPGVPHELQALMVDQVLTCIQKESANTQSMAPANPIRYRVLRTTGIAESLLAEKVDHILPDLAPLTLASLPGFAGTDLRLTSWGELTSDRADQALEGAVQRIRAELHSHIYGEDGDELAAVVGLAMREHGWRITVAESCTGGLLGKLLSDAPGASDYFTGGVIAYSNALKLSQLNVSPLTLETFGAVSEDVAREMAMGAQRLGNADAAIAVTGIAGPGGGSKDKPVGTVWLAAALHDELQTRRIILPGDRNEIRERAAYAGLALLWKMLRATGAHAGSANSARGIA
ncbi:MAG: competence/damage-inducible protein A [Longimicrobiales bacterium]